MNKATANGIFEILIQNNPEPKSELKFSNALECLIAVLLSAQCTDRRVNLATDKLFAKYKSLEDYANCNEEDLSSFLKTINFYPTKVKNLLKIFEILKIKFNGQVPSNLTDLMSLPGVGKKTAQVVLVEFFKIPAVPVDTHVFRVCNRLGIIKATSVQQTESAIRTLFEKEKLCNLHKLLVLHGRYVCKARQPNCAECVLKNVCEKRI